MTQNDLNIEEISPKVWVLKDSGAIVVESNTVTAADYGGNGGKALKIKVGATEAEIWSWGSDNNLPSDREALIKENNIVGELISTKRTVTLGAGLNFYKKRYEGGQEIKELVPAPTWFDELSARMNMGEFMRGQTNNVFTHANIFIRGVREGNDKIHSLKVLSCRHVRAEKQDKNGKIKNYFWCGDWKAKYKYNKPDEFPIRRIPAYDPTQKQSEFMLHFGDNLFTDDYYYEPTWWFGRKWIELANRIPIFHLSNLKHGYLIRYHVEIPKDYFYDRSSAQQAQNDAASLQKVKDLESAARQKFIETVNDLFAGESKAGRALFTEYEINRQIQKDYPGIKIHAIETDIKDEALLKLFAASNDANISGQGIHPALAAIQTAGKLSSGSEIQNAHTMYIATKSPTPRSIITQFFDVLKAEMGQDLDVFMGFNEIKIAQLNQDKSGMQEGPAAA